MTNKPVDKILKTHEELWQMVKDYELHRWRKHDYDHAFRKLSSSDWWTVYEYLDWKYNNSAYTDLAFSKQIDDWNRP